MTSSVAITARGAAHGLERLERRVKALENTLVALLMCVGVGPDVTHEQVSRLDKAMMELADTASDWSRVDA